MRPRLYLIDRSPDPRGSTHTTTINLFDLFCGGVRRNRLFVEFSTPSRAIRYF